MTQEEKAKAYDEALSRARKLYNDEQTRVGLTPIDLESIFPELVEPEDERIREYLIRYIDNTMKSSELKSKLLTWLEKQDPKKHEEELENAYKAGAQWQKKHLFDNRIKDCNNITEEQYNLETEFLDGWIEKYDRLPTFLDAIEYGMNYKKE